MIRGRRRRREMRYRKKGVNSVNLKRRTTPNMIKKEEKNEKEEEKEQ